MAVGEEDAKKDNRRTLQWLFDNGRIDLRRGPIFDLDPGPMPDSFDFDRVEGMMRWPFGPWSR